MRSPCIDSHPLVASNDMGERQRMHYCHVKTMIAIISFLDLMNIVNGLLIALKSSESERLHCIRFILEILLLNSSFANLRCCTREICQYSKSWIRYLLLYLITMHLL